MLSDGDLEKTTKLPIPAAGESAWIQYEFAEPQTIRAITIVTKNAGWIAAMLAGIGSPEKSLEASDDGQDFRAVVKLPDGGAPEHTVSFPPVTAKFFRVVFKRTPPPPLPAWASGIDPASMGIKIGQPPTDYEIAELVLHPGARVNRFEDKAAFSSRAGPLRIRDAPGRCRRCRCQVRCDRPDFEDAARTARSTGRLPPAIGSSSGSAIRCLGITNHPATAEATGLEVDKLNRGLCEELHGHLPGQLQADGGRGLTWASAASAT